MKKVMIIALILVGALLIPAVSAEEHLLTDSDASQIYYVNTDKYQAYNLYSENLYLKFLRIQDYPYLTFAFVESPVGTTEFNAQLIANPSGNDHVTIKDGSTVIGEGTIFYSVNFLDETPKSIQVWVEIDSWDIGTRTGTKALAVIPDNTSTLLYKVMTGSRDDLNETCPIMFGDTGIIPDMIYGHQIFRSTYEWSNTLSISETEVALVRDENYSHFIIDTGSGLFVDNSSNDVSFPNVGMGTWTIINSRGREYTGTLGSAVPTDTNDVTVYVRNSQTGALLADAHIFINASVNDEFYVVVNETIPGGIATYNLQPTGGGLPNPDYYRLITSLEGYNPYMPYIDFELDRTTTLIVEMEPTTGAPEDDNMTFIEFYVRDIAANPISGATVTCGGLSLITNSAGFTQFEMPVNASYSYNVSKSGYLTIEGIATVGSDDRYVVNVALMAGAVPTHTVVTPTITVEPTPTQTTPPIQEDNIIGLSVRGLAKGFGIDYDTALLLFGLMIVFGAGGIVMSSAKGGAMEFIGGSIVGTFVAFALGLIPIWIFIIIAVVFGAYVLRVFLQGGQ